MKRIILAFCILLVAVTSVATGSQDFVGVLNDAPYKIRVPDKDWNGVLLLHAHWYYFPPPPEAEAALGGKELEDFLLSKGYAVAGSTFRNSGWQVKEGTQDLIALSGLFNDLVGKPKRRILMGYSMGSLIALKSAEEVPLYDGVIPMCSLAGSSSVNDRDGGIAYAYATAFGWPREWGTWYDARDGLSFFGEVYTPLLAQLMDPSNFGKFEFIRLLFDLPFDGFYYAPPPLNPAMGFLMLATTEVKAEIEARAKGYVYENAGHVYSLSDEEKAYLASLGVDAEKLLVEMNKGATISVRKPQRQYIEKYFDPSGHLRRPVLSVHSINDYIYPPYFETQLLQKVKSASREDLFLQVYTDGFGHCSFTKEQILAAVRAMEYWLDTEIKPIPEDLPVLFPDSLGFIPGYAPPAWPIGEEQECPIGNKHGKSFGKEHDRPFGKK